MRYAWLFAVLMLILAACSGNDNDETPTPAATPTPVAEIVPTEEPTEPEATPTPEPEPTPTPEDDTDVDDEELQVFVQTVAEQVAEMRGLEILEDLDFTIMTQDELREFIEEETDIEQAELDLYWSLRLHEDRDLDLVELLIEMQVEETLGLYDPETRQTYLISDEDELSPLREVLLAHEIVHALQDQHFDLGRLGEMMPDRDASLAFRTIVEGEAVLSQELYAQQYLSNEQQMEYLREAMSLLQTQDPDEMLDQLPRYYAERFTFPYTAGVQLALNAFDGSFDGIDALLEDPPRSSWQVMNPEAYLAGEIDDPVDIDMPDYAERLDGDWEAAVEGTLGAFDLAIMLEENGIESADEALTGWAGTEVVMYQLDDDLLTVLATVWESEEDAAGFEEALRQTFDGYDEADGIWSNNDLYFAIVTEGTSVNLKSSTDPEALQAVIAG